MQISLLNFISTPLPVLKRVRRLKSKEEQVTLVKA
jgi:hypothetical protein